MAFVYVIVEKNIIGELSGPWLKIGFSKNPPKWRMDANLKRGNPRALEVLAQYKFENEQEARNAERAAHSKFSDCASPNGKEWFSIAPEAVISWFAKCGYRRVSDT